tara:strand:+ start:264 stop:656 length:393 start_codon:yes stop_codon:yes gene_type:complete
MRNITLAALHDLLIEAAETERMLPPAIRKQKLATWPDSPDEWTAYGYTDAETRRPKPSPKQIDEWSEMLQTLLRLPDADDRKLMWAVAHSAAFRERGPAWKKLAKILHCDYRTVKRKYENALTDLWFIID